MRTEAQKIATRENHAIMTLKCVISQVSGLKNNAHLTGRSFPNTLIDGDFNLIIYKAKRTIEKIKNIQDRRIMRRNNE